MIGQTVSHYPALRDPVQRDKILEKFGEVPKSPTSDVQRVVATLRIPTSSVGSSVWRIEQ